MIKQFKTTLEKSGTRIGIFLPFNPDEAWDVKERHHVSGSVNGCGVRGALVLEGSRYFLPLGPAWRRDNGIELGAAVEVTLAPEGPQPGQLSPDIAEALEREPQAKAFFNSLATFYRKAYLKWVEGARQPQARAARIQELVELLKAGKKQK